MSEHEPETATIESELRAGEQSEAYSITDEECRSEYGLALRDAELLRHRFIDIASQFALSLQKGAFSVTIRDMQDFGVGIMAPYEPDDDLHMDLLASAEGCPIHFFNLQYKARNNILEYGIDNLEPGDVLVYNDVFRGGSHVMDVQTACPVFYEDEVVAFINVDGHFTDIGGAVPGGFSPGMTDMYSEGLRLSPRLLYSEGEPVKETFDLFLDNVRVPEMTFADLENYGATLLQARELVEETYDNWGTETVNASRHYILDYGERRMRAALDQLPDGTYEGSDFIDDDGVSDEQHEIQTTLNVFGDHAELDFSGSAAQVEGNINASPSDVASAGLISLMSILLNNVHVSAGMFRAIDMQIPQGSILYALPPAATTQGHLIPTMKTCSAIQHMLSAELPEHAIAEDYNDAPTISMSGWDRRGGQENYFLIFQVPYGPYGGTCSHDGHCYSLQFLGNCREMAYEIEEEIYPHVVLRKEFVEDSAGAGEYRGGPAIRWDQLLRFDGELSASFDHLRQRTMGVNGGQGGDPAYLFEIDPDAYDIEEATECYEATNGRTPPAVRKMIAGVYDPETGELDLENGEFESGKFSGRALPAWQPWVNVVAGGGGNGSPLDRDPEAVRDDVRDDLVSIEAAEETYGVVLDPSTLTIDHEATATKREGMEVEE